MRRVLFALVTAGLVAAVAGCGGSSSAPKSAAKPPSALLHPASLHATAPPIFDVAFTTTQGTFTVRVHRSWAPHGADRAYNLVRARFFDGVSFFRVVAGFVVQFGISPDPVISRAWENAAIPDDPVAAHNTKGAVSFASAGPGTRTTQLFVDLGDNRSLDRQGFAPVGRVVGGMDVVERLYGGYGEQPTSDQQQIAAQGQAFLDGHFPKLDRIVTARVVPASG